MDTEDRDDPMWDGLGSIDAFIASPSPNHSSSPPASPHSPSPWPWQRLPPPPLLQVRLHDGEPAHQSDPHPLDLILPPLPVAAGRVEKPGPSSSSSVSTALSPHASAAVKLELELELTHSDSDPSAAAPAPVPSAALPAPPVPPAPPSSSAPPVAAYAARAAAAPDMAASALPVAPGCEPPPTLHARTPHAVSVSTSPTARNAVAQVPRVNASGATSAPPPRASPSSAQRSSTGGSAGASFTSDEQRIQHAAGAAQPPPASGGRDAVELTGEDLSALEAAGSLKEKREREAKQFPKEVLGNLDGTTSAEVRKMNATERELVLYKRKLRNRESARRSRQKRQATLAELQEEIDDLMQVTGRMVEVGISLQEENSGLRERLKSTNLELKGYKAMYPDSGVAPADTAADPSPAALKMKLGG